MNVYQGYGRRQVGGGIWSTIRRGAKPFIMNVLNKLKPHAISAGKHVANSPVSKFEPWSPPGNLDYCMALGYIEASRDYICMTSRCIPSYVGAWRASPPII